MQSFCARAKLAKASTAQQCSLEDEEVIVLGESTVRVYTTDLLHSELTEVIGTFCAPLVVMHVHKVGCCSSM